MSELDYDYIKNIKIGGDDPNTSFDITLELETGFITPKLVWDTRKQWTDFIANSKEIYEKMNDDQQAAATRLIRTALERMYDNAGEWIPECLSTDGGDYVEAHIRVIFTDIDKEVERFEEASTFQLKQAEEDAKRMMGLVNDAPDLTPGSIRGTIEGLDLDPTAKAQVLTALKLG